MIVEEQASEATPEEFLNRLGERLKQDPNADSALANILITHILKAAPTQDAVARAKAAVVQVAVDRAKTSWGG
ncbi:hypothetical protein [Sinorhizobium sp. M4_45]|uniref:hypothetical protein n=1 Tax=Sinorhizobium sp. M4_45 TaxID=2037901 RepID=UPI000C9BD925|nr:hypothetical protein [Sinorhizobium sp. M4_45]PND27612.1 hypothetical protein CN933_05650 [Sinorhizobium sp. M4_45]